MLRHEDNMALTQVGSGTPMGEFMRRHWIPAIKLEQIVEALTQHYQAEKLKGDGDDLVAA